MRLLYLTFFFVSINGFCFIYAIEIPEHLKSLAKKLHDRCQKETGVVEELIQQSTRGKLSDDRTLQCYIYCLFEKIGLIDEDNVIHLEHLTEVLPPESHSLVEKLVNTCGTKSGADGCETSYLTVKCYFDASPFVFQNALRFIAE